jgi:hypothetical protein
MKQLPWPLNRRIGGGSRTPDDSQAPLPTELPPILKRTVWTIASLLVGFALAASGFATIGTAANAIVLTSYLVGVHRDTRAAPSRSPSVKNSVIFYVSLITAFALAIAIGRVEANEGVAACMFGIGFLALAVRALHYDYARARYSGKVFRAERPIYYWFLTGTLVFVSGLMLCLGTWAVGTWAVGIAAR